VRLAVLEQPRVKRLMSTDLFSVNGTLIEVCASMNSFRPKEGADEPPSESGGRNKEADFHGEKRLNESIPTPWATFSKLREVT
jgi:hypothetical protein